MRADSIRFKIRHRRVFRWLDIAVVTIILFHIGALVTTNILSEKRNPEQKILETNPVQSAAMGTVLEPKHILVNIPYIMDSLGMSALVIFYVIKRIYISDEADFKVLVGLIIILLIVSGTDFFNNLGYYIGNLIYG